MALHGTFEYYPYQQFGLFCEWNGVQDAVNNRTTITLKVYASYYTLNIGTKSGSTTVNGSTASFTSPEIRDMAGGGYKKKLIATRVINVSHNSDGTKTNVGLKAVWNCALHYHDVYYASLTAQTSVDLSPIDRSRPVVTVQLDQVDSTTATFNITSNSTCDSWYYQLNGGDYVAYSTREGQSTSLALTGLTPGEEYELNVKARRKSNQLESLPVTVEFQTEGGAALESCSPIIADAEYPQLKFAYTAYDTDYTYNIAVKDGSTTLFTITGLTVTTGFRQKTINLTAEQVTALMTAIPTDSEKEFTVEMTTVDGNNNPVGSPQTKPVLVQITDASAPVFTSASYQDIAPNPLSVTGNDQIIIQNQSSLRVICDTATPATGATIVEYAATIGGKTVTSNTTTIAFGYCTETETQLVVSAKDSRGMVTSITLTITLLPYADPVYTEWEIGRENGIGADINVSFSGTFSSLMINGVEKNQVKLIHIYYGLYPNGSMTDGGSLLSDVSVSGTSFTYTGQPLSLPVDNTYRIALILEDALTYHLYTFGLVEKGIPIIAIRDTGVGIMQNNPASALDVVGDIKQNGQVVMGFGSTLESSTDLDTVTKTGYYAQPQNSGATTSKHYPVDSKAGILEVLAEPNGHVMQRYTTYDLSGLYVRYRFLGTWRNWKSITLS